MTGPAGPVVDEGAVLLSRIDRTLCDWDRRILRQLLGRYGLPTLDELAAELEPYGSGRPHVFAAVARLEDRGWLPKGQIRCAP